MTKQVVAEMIYEYLRTDGKMGIGQTIPPDTNLLDGGFLDSIGFLEIISHLEAQLNISIDILDIDPTELVIFGNFESFIFEQANSAN